MATVFVTGTDTGVGKTVVSCALLQYWQGCGMKVAGFKPVASGAEPVNGRLQNADALALQRFSNCDLPYALVNPYVFEPATAPHIAAREVGESIDTAVLDRTYSEIARRCDNVVIEGAGGWRVPLDDKLSFADWVAGHRWPVLLVVSIKLGCINHAILSWRDIQRAGVSLAGWIANMTEEHVPYARQMITSIETVVAEPCLGVIPHEPHLSGSLMPDFLADLTGGINWRAGACF